MSIPRVAPSSGTAYTWVQVRIRTATGCLHADGCVYESTGCVYAPGYCVLFALSRVGARIDVYYPREPGRGLVRIPARTGEGVRIRAPARRRIAVYAGARVRLRLYASTRSKYAARVRIHTRVLDSILSSSAQAGCVLREYAALMSGRDRWTGVGCGSTWRPIYAPLVTRVARRRR